MKPSIVQTDMENGCVNVSSPFRFYDETEQRFRPGLKRLLRLNLRQNEFLDFPVNHGIYLRPDTGYIDFRIETDRIVEGPWDQYSANSILAREIISIPVLVTRPLQLFRILWGQHRLVFTYRLEPGEPRYAGDLVSRTQTLQIPTRSIPIVRTGHPIHDFEHMTPAEKAMLVTIDDVQIFCQHDISLEDK